MVYLNVVENHRGAMTNSSFKFVEYICIYLCSYTSGRFLPQPVTSFAVPLGTSDTD